MLDAAAMQRLSRSHFAPNVYKRYGREGTRALREILAFLPRLYAYIDPETVTAGLVVFRTLTAGAVPAALTDLKPKFVRRLDVLPQTIQGSVALEVLDDGVNVWPVPTCGGACLSADAVVYTFSGTHEAVVVDATEYRLPNPDPAHASVFARPTFSSLRDALERYARSMARVSSCMLLGEAWADASRLFVKRLAEREMRRSLHQYLMCVLRDADVQPEQNVDESHPVDITVRWVLSNRTAIIEIKWLGKSLHEGRITVTHADQRARDGAQQLAEYLDAQRTSVPSRIVRGYLVVFDARRRGLNERSTTVSRPNGLYYADREITYDPAYHHARPDFEEPVRMFIEPVCISA